MEQLTKLHRQLGALKRKLADTMKPFNQPATDMSVGAWEPRLQFIRGLREDAKVLENAAYELTDDDQEFDKEVERFANFEQILLEAEVKISKLKIPAEEKPPMLPGSNDRGSRLPTISLKTFSGQHEDWNAFFAQFTSMIHNQKDLSAVDKFHYLVSYLSGEAFQVVKELEIVESNYEIALELLKNAYEDKRLIIRKYINQLLNLKPIVTESAAELRALCNVVNQSVSVLKKMGLHTDMWNEILVCLVETKLDKVSRRDWEETISANKEFPTFEELNTFLDRRSKMLRSLSNSAATTAKQAEEKKGSQGFTKRKTLVVSGEDTQVSCKLCNETGHRLRQCEAFQRLGIEERINKARELSLCLNCLGPGNHTSRQCKFGRCKKCGKSHNTLLHRITDTPSSGALAGNSADNSGAASNQTAVNGTGNALPASRRQGDAQVMLATAVVYVFDRFGKKQMCRVGLDSYAQSNFITENLCQKLQLQKSTCNISISGIGDSSLFIRHSANVTIKSRYSGAELNMTALVIPVITDNLPSALFDPAKLKLPPYVQLADPEFYVPKKIDMLVGAEFFFQILIPGQMLATPNLPTLQNTIFGWVLSGNLDLSEDTQEQNRLSTSAVICNLSVEENLSDQLTKFWEIEQPIVPEQTLTQEEYICEQHFVTNTKRDETGQFVVRLPLKKETSDLGTSYQGALRRFLSLERRLENNPEVKAKYHDFMAEYLALGHMNEVGSDQIMYQPSYFLPHHCVFNENSITTRLRVVFDASHKTSSGKSLNDILCVGAQTQPELMTILLNFRMGQYAISADIRRMYRMVKVDNRDIGLQQILWRFDQDQAVSTYVLNTVTYGTACAPFLATRCLLELANTGASTFPLASKATRENFYMDDLLLSVSTPDKAAELIKQLVDLLHSANFQLHKWHTNHTPLLDTIKTAQQTSEPPQISEVTHALGIEWRPQTDEFTVKVPDIDLESAITRRSILSDTAKLFDPLGLISPVVVRAKMFMQDLCRVKMSWDEPVAAEQCRLWQKYRQELLTINSIKYPRWVIGHNGTGKIQIHGFCDSSLRAMGCVIYIRFETDEGEIFVQLLCAKSRVTPLKKGTYTIPRLELCAAELLAKVSNRVQTDLKLKEAEMFLWSDSTITLSWISQDSAQFKIFVATRIQRIQSLTKDATWHHVSSKDNPADIVSRGATVRDLKSSSLWFKGPAWLSSPQEEWPTFNAVRDTEVRNPSERFELAEINCSVSTHDSFGDFIHKFSSIHKLNRVIAYWRRFMYNCRHSKAKKCGPLSATELKESLDILVKIEQRTYLFDEIKQLQKPSRGKPVKCKTLQSLDPFLDDKGMLRVGGRLRHAEVSMETRCPLIIPKGHLAKLLARNEHQILLHAGPQHVLASMRLRWWPLGGRNLVRKIIKQCITCFRINPPPCEQFMGSLPKARVNQARPFLHCGCDFAGPVKIRPMHGRKGQTRDAFIAVFICMVTKAVHLEAVSNLSADAFTAALKRLIGRRGRIAHFYCDNGKNFIGAKRELTQLRQIFLSQESNQFLREYFSKEGITWHFIPPNAPHFGGLWEAAVRSVKKHLYRVTANASLNFEELTTLLVQIEAVLNSRPITTLSEDPKDLEYLTPGHFLSTGGPLTALPEPDLTELPVNRLSSWQRVQQLLQHFWNRWSVEYLTQLQQRPKWLQKKKNLQEGDVVLLREDKTPPMFWPIGRIIKTFPGADNLIRVVELKLKDGRTFKRPISKISLLPIDDDDQL